MCSRLCEIVLGVFLALVVAGCQTPAKDQAPAVPPTTQEQLGGISFEFPRVAELNDLWREMIEPFKESAYLEVFERGDVELVVCMQPEGAALGCNTLVIYTYDGLGKQYCPRVYWNTMLRGSNEVIGVHITFNYEAGTIEALSPRGKFIFGANISALAPKEPEELFPGKSAVKYPAFRTLAGLKSSAEEDGRLYVFEKGKVTVGVRVQSWGAKCWKGLILYTFDEVANLWSPRAIWDTGAREVRVSFKKSTGMIEVRSGNGALIFQANIAALEGVPRLFGNRPACSAALNATCWPDNPSGRQPCQFRPSKPSTISYQLSTAANELPPP